MRKVQATTTHDGHMVPGKLKRLFDQQLVL